MISLIAALVIVAIAIMIVVSERRSRNNMKSMLEAAQEKTFQFEKKIEASREELRKNKEELEREKGALRDARELAKKKLRRHANAETDSQISPSEAAMNTTFDDKEKVIVAMEAQIEQLKKDQHQNEEAIRAKVIEEMSKKDEEKVLLIEDLKKKISTLQEEVKKQKRLMRPEGVKIDLKTLPDEAASEFARVYRKAEQHERLHGIARAKLHLAQEKFTELQKRYFSVCRELAVSVGGKPDLEPSQARDMAEKIVAEGHGHDTHRENGESEKESA